MHFFRNTAPRKRSVGAEREHISEVNILDVVQNKLIRIIVDSVKAYRVHPCTFVFCVQELSESLKRFL